MLVLVLTVCIGGGCRCTKVLVRLRGDQRLWLRSKLVIGVTGMVYLGSDSRYSAETAISRAVGADLLRAITPMKTTTMAEMQKLIASDKLWDLYPDANTVDAFPGVRTFAELAEVALESSAAITGLFMAERKAKAAEQAARVLRYMFLYMEQAVVFDRKIDSLVAMMWPERIWLQRPREEREENTRIVWSICSGQDGFVSKPKGKLCGRTGLHVYDLMYVFGPVVLSQKNCATFVLKLMDAIRTHRDADTELWNSWVAKADKFEVSKSLGYIEFDEQSPVVKEMNGEPGWEYRLRRVLAAAIVVASEQRWERIKTFGTKNCADFIQSDYEKSERVVVSSTPQSVQEYQTPKRLTGLSEDGGGSSISPVLKRKSALGVGDGNNQAKRKSPRLKKNASPDYRVGGGVASASKSTRKGNGKGRGSGKGVSEIEFPRTFTGKILGLSKDAENNVMVAVDNGGDPMEVEKVGEGGTDRPGGDDDGGGGNLPTNEGDGKTDGNVQLAGEDGDNGGDPMEVAKDDDFGPGRAGAGGDAGDGELPANQTDKTIMNSVDEVESNFESLDLDDEGNVLHNSKMRAENIAVTNSSVYVQRFDSIDLDEVESNGPVSEQKVKECDKGFAVLEAAFEEALCAALEIFRKRFAVYDDDSGRKWVARDWLIMVKTVLKREENNDPGRHMVLHVSDMLEMTDTSVAPGQVIIVKGFSSVENGCDLVDEVVHGCVNQGWRGPENNVRALSGVLRVGGQSDYLFSYRIPARVCADTCNRSPYGLVEAFVSLRTCAGGEPSAGGVSLVSPYTALHGAGYLAKWAPCLRGRACVRLLHRRYEVDAKKTSDAFVAVLMVDLELVGPMDGRDEESLDDKIWVERVRDHGQVVLLRAGEMAVVPVGWMYSYLTLTPVVVEVRERFGKGGVVAMVEDWAGGVERMARLGVVETTVVKEELLHFCSWVKVGSRRLVGGASVEVVNGIMSVADRVLKAGHTLSAR